MPNCISFIQVTSLHKIFSMLSGSCSIKGKEIEYSPVLEEGWRTQVCISSEMFLGVCANTWLGGQGGGGCDLFLYFCSLSNSLFRY